MRLILASASPRRAELLAAAGFACDVVPADVDEALREGEAPEAYVRRLADEKSAAVLARVPAAADAIVIGADTTVVVDGRVLGKPRDPEEAARMLRQLSGRRHQVLTGVSVRRNGQQAGCVETTDVWFAPMTSEDISWYVASGEGLDKAGAYAIQGLASRFISRIHGSYTNVVGLPVRAVVELVRALASSDGRAYS
jgi:septum formation protein